LVFYPLAENRAEYWIADKAGFYDERRYEEARRSRSKAKMVDSLMGENNPELPDSYFDLVFSVSVLEHIPKDALSSAVADMHRILKPNGLFLHSLDLKRGKEAFEAEFRAQVERVGFEWLEPPQPIDFTVDGLLFEPLDIVFEYYDKREEMQYKLRAVGAHTGTVLVGARKRSTSDPGSIDPAIAGSAESGSAKIDFWRRLFRRGS
jgi:SAM-dependent methyltransferase